MSGYYAKSWDLYKSYYQEVDIDLAYYLDLCRGYKTLDMFAGFGRVTNYLACNGVDVDAVESEREFAKFIQLSERNKHICDVLQFQILKKYDRIIAPFNSFCLLLDKLDIVSFFKKIDSLALPKAIISLSYYHHDFWPEACATTDYFNYKGCKVQHKSKYDLSHRADGVGVWSDVYSYNQERDQFDYSVRLYESERDLDQFLIGTDLKIIDVINDFNRNDLEYPGWKEFVLVKL